MSGYPIKNRPKPYDFERGIPEHIAYGILFVLIIVVGLLVDWLV